MIKTNYLLFSLLGSLTNVFLDSNDLVENTQAHLMLTNLNTCMALSLSTDI